MRKSIFIGIKDVQARYITQIVGALVCLQARSIGQVQSLTGHVVQVLPKTHGTLLLIKNLYYHDYRLNVKNPYPNALCVGWPIIPLWVSECGESGILATWKKDPDLSTHIEDYQRHVDREADNCMAL
jgi:hypothetical protein